MASESKKTLRLAVTAGDPAGVGPEIVLRLFAEGGWPEGTAPFVVGERRLLESARNSLPDLDVEITALDAPPDAPPPPRTAPVVQPRDFKFDGLPEPGQVSAQCGAAAWAYIRQAASLVQSGQADAIVTAPIHKEALQAAGCPFTGHTTMLAHMAGDARVGMLLVGGGLRVGLATIHKAIAQVPALLNPEMLLEHLRLMDRFIPLFGLEGRERPRIAVCGLNPHAGEGGLFGPEDSEIIAPAVRKARNEGIDAAGPLPADTIFHLARQGAYDAILAMYHDQALIPVKTLDFHRGVNVTMGLPYIRTSVDHGTAFDIAGQGKARPDSLRAALETAALLARNRSAKGRTTSEC